MIDLLIFYGLGVILGTLIQSENCPKTDHKRTINRPIRHHKVTKKRPLTKRRPFLPWEIRRNR